MFARSVKIDNLSLPSEGVYILWKWQENETSFGDTEDEPSRSYDQDSLSQECEQDGLSQYTCDDESECDEKENAGTHTVTFKCIGASKCSNSQEILKLVNESLSRKCDVPVDIFPEPDNPFDSRAIAFKARIENKWHTIGYVVREATEAVHDVMSRKAIVNVKFAWAKYLILWSRSGPGYYAGIDITTQGRWPPVVVKSASTQ